MADSVFITWAICNKSSKNIFFHSSNHKHLGKGGSGQMFVVTCSSSVDYFVLIHSAQELNLHLVLYFAFPRCVYYLLFRTEKPVFPVDLQAEIVTLAKTKAKKENLYAL